MKRYARIFTALFLAAFSLSMIAGQTFPGQGYLIGGIGLAAAVCVAFDK